MDPSTPELPPAYSLVHLTECESTNCEARKKSEEGVSERLWIVADRQTKGRGRSGRRWASLEGNLFASLLLPLHCPVETATQISFVAALAVADALEKAAGDAKLRSLLTLKWPNDILLQGRKAGGILIESSNAPSSGAAVVIVGIGVNLEKRPDIQGVATSCLLDHGVHCNKWILFAELAKSFDCWLSLWDAGNNFEEIRKSWLARAHGIGAQLRASASGKAEEGRFRGLDPTGALILEKPNGVTHLISSGEVFFLQNAENKP